MAAGWDRHGNGSCNTEVTVSEISRRPGTFLNTETVMKELEVRGQPLHVIFCSLPESPWVQLKGSIKASFFA